MLTGFLLFCFLLLPAALFPATICHANEAPLYIAAVGDSLTAGFGVAPQNSYPVLLEQELKQIDMNCTIRNFGISGEMSSDTLARIQPILQTKPDLIILEIGINDALNELPIDTIRSNITEIIEQAEAKEVEIILVGVKHIWSWDKEYASAFAELYREIARRHTLLLVPSMLDGVAAVPAMTLPDTIHPNEQGYRQVLDNMLPTITLWLKNHSSGSASPSGSFSSPR